MTTDCKPPVIRRQPLPSPPCSRRTEPSAWLCPPPGRARVPDGFQVGANNLAQWLADAAERAKKTAEAEHPDKQTPPKQMPLRLASSRMNLS
ncbi:MAG: hypothetical protein ACRCV9_09765 [Burkholderiaceae bacterium]